MKYPDLMSGIFWIAVGLLLSIWSTRYQIGSLTQPGSGFFPLGLGLLLIFLSVILLVQRKKSSLAQLPSSHPTGGWKKVAYTFLILLLVTFMFEKVGYLLTLFLMIIFLMRVAEPQKWRTTLLVAFFSIMGVYLVFVLLLKQLYPRGLLGI